MNCRIATLYLTNKPIHIYRTQYLFTCIAIKTVNVDKIAKFIVIILFQKLMKHLYQRIKRNHVLFVYCCRNWCYPCKMMLNKGS